MVKGTHAPRSGGRRDVDHSCFLKLPRLPQQGEKVHVQQVWNRQTGWPPNTLVLWGDSVSVGGLTQAEDCIIYDYLLFNRER